MLIAAVLAAGRSTRMGKNKLLLPLGNRPVLCRVVDTIADVQPSRILVIANADHAAAIAAAIVDTPAEVVINPRAREGMGTSIACAAAALSESVESLLLAQGDQPLVSHEALARLIERHRIGSKAYVAARYGDLVTTPVLFGRRLFVELRELTGDRGARGVLDRHRDDGEVVDLPPWMALDVDDEASYRRLQELWPPPSGA